MGLEREIMIISLVQYLLSYYDVKAAEDAGDAEHIQRMVEDLGFD